MKIKTMFENPFTPVGVNKKVYDRYENVYTEIPPFAINPETGDFINKSPLPKIVYTGKIDVQERIQSFEAEQNIYNILTRLAVSGDTSLLNARPCIFSDVVDIPDNINDFGEYMKTQVDRFKQVNDVSISKAIINGGLTQSMIDEYIQKLVAASIANNTNNGGNE